MNSLIRITLLFGIAGAFAALPLQIPAQTTNKNTEKGSTAKTPSSKESDSKSRPIPFSGNIGEVNKAEKTIKVGKRTLQITSETKISKDEKPATLDNTKVGDYVTGSYKKGEDGKLFARTIYIGGKQKGKTSEKRTEK